MVIAQRLKKGLTLPSTTDPPTPTSSRQIHILDSLLSRISQTSTCIDDAAERLYTHDALGAILTVEKARACVVEVVESVREGWHVKPTPTPGTVDTVDKERSGETTKEDRYIARALAWIRDVSM